MLGVKAIEGEVLPAGEWDPDTERLFADFRDSFQQGEMGGTIYVSRIPLDANGNPMGNSKQQSRLFEVPLGTLTLDDICNRVKREFMRRDEYRICVRIIGVQPGQQGPRFNRIVTIERPNDTEPEKGSGLGGDIAAILSAFQRNSDANMQRMEMLMSRVIDAQARSASAPVAPVAPVDPMAMMQGVIGMMAVAQKMFAVPAGAAIPGATAADPLDQLTKLAGLAPRLSRMFGGDQDKGNDMGNIISTVAPAVAEFFKAINHERARAPAAVARRIAPPQRRAETPAQEVQREVRETVAQATSVNQPERPAVQSAKVEATPEMPADMMAQIKEIVSGLIVIAQGDPGGNSCDEAARDVLAEIPDELDEQIFELVRDSGSFKMKLAFVDPRTALHHEWFESFRQCVKAAFEVPGAP